MKTMYIKTFSKGQMTVPKAIRKQWGVTDEFWLKLTLEEDNSLRLEPMEQPQDAEKTLKRLQSLLKPKANWFGDLDHSSVVRSAENQLKKKLGDW